MKLMQTWAGRLRKVKTKMNVLTAVNSAYLLPLVVMLQSLFDNNSKIDVYLLYSDLKAEELNALGDFIRSKNSVLFPLKIESAAFTNAPTLKYITKETYYRLLAAEILPDTVERLLWLDADIIVAKNIEKFYNTDFDGNCFAACSYGTPMKKMIADHCLELGIPDSSKYFNAGVLLYSMEALRKINVKKLVDDCLTDQSKLKFADQDVLNLIFYNQVKIEDYRYYNAMIHCIANPEEQDFMSENAVIIHFPGEAKPWKFNDLPFSDLWLYYYNRSPYGKTPIRRNSYFRLKAAFEKMQGGKNKSGETIHDGRQ